MLTLMSTFERLGMELHANLGGLVSCFAEFYINRLIARSGVYISLISWRLSVLFRD